MVSKEASQKPDQKQQTTTQTALTEAQAEVLSFIKEKCESSGMPPSYREIQNHFGYKAVGTVQDHVRALLKKGQLIQKGKARGILPANFQAAKQVPVYGEIAAGSTRDSQQLEMGQLAVSVTMAKDPTFALRVVGNSMIDVGIFEGDYLIVDKSAPVRSGDIIVALLEGETTVKRYEKKNGKIRLIPENSRMKPIEVESERFEIQGKVVGLQRKF